MCVSKKIKQQKRNGQLESIFFLDNLEEKIKEKIFKMKWFSILVNLFFVITLSACEELDLYGILGINRNAETKAIKKAYRRLANTEHPDKKPDDPEATAKFANINTAYKVLSNEETRKLYDRCGMKCVEREGQLDNSDVFSSFFGDFGFGGFGDERGARETPKGGTIVMNLFVTLEELYSGNFVEVRISFSKQIYHNPNFYFIFILLHSLLSNENS